MKKIFVFAALLCIAMHTSVAASGYEEYESSGALDVPSELHVDEASLKHYNDMLQAALGELVPSPRAARMAMLSDFDDISRAVLDLMSESLEPFDEAMRAVVWSILAEIDFHAVEEGWEVTLPLRIDHPFLRLTSVTVEFSNGLLWKQTGVGYYIEEAADFLGLGDQYRSAMARVEAESLRASAELLDEESDKESGEDFDIAPFTPNMYNRGARGELNVFDPWGLNPNAVATLAASSWFFERAASPGFQRAFFFEEGVRWNPRSVIHDRRVVTGTTATFCSVLRNGTLQAQAVSSFQVNVVNPNNGLVGQILRDVRMDPW